MDNHYEKIIDKLIVISHWLLLQTAHEQSPAKHYYLRNSLAKTISLAKSIFLLNTNEQFNEGWILFRSLVDRLVYIYYLDENSNYEDFEKWTFLKTYEMINNARSDEQIQSVKNNPLFQLTKDSKSKYARLCKEKIEWNKPKPDDVLRKEDLNFIYKFSYDYASTKTHPMFNDGDEEFHAITKLTPNPYSDMTHEELLPNTILLSTMIVQKCLENFDLEFITVLYEWLGELRKEIRKEENSSLELSLAIGKYIQNGGLAFRKV